MFFNLSIFITKSERNRAWDARTTDPAYLNEEETGRGLIARKWPDRNVTKSPLRTLPVRLDFFASQLDTVKNTGTARSIIGSLKQTSLYC